jgi:hypothetical protein
MKKYGMVVLATIMVLSSCEKDSNTSEFVVDENPATFKEIGSITIGGVGAAEISAYDETTKKLFTVNNSTANKVDVIDLSDPKKPILLASIEIANGAANSIAAFNGKFAVAYESKSNKQEPGKVVLFNAITYAKIMEITVGALPDMITFSPDGKYILTANEGEPNDTYSLDPNGSVSIIDLSNNYAVTTLDFSSFSTQLNTLKTSGFRIANPTNNFAADIEPEYITISSDSKTAWVTLQENNGVAKIDLSSKTISSIFPLGFKDYNSTSNAIDISDKDLATAFNPWKVKGMFMPDAIANYSINGDTYFITANEGDAREYSAFKDIKRMKDCILDASAFPDASVIKADSKLGRLNLVSTMGDTDNDGDLDELVSFGARSFSIWNGNTGSLVFDSKNDLDKRSNDFATYDDGRSDDKGAEPESVVVAKMGDKSILFVGLERADTVMIYDITNPASPQYLQSIKTGDAPEGLLFIPASKSPTKRSLVIVSSEGDGSVKIYQPDLK